MKIEEKFNLRSAQLVTVNSFYVNCGPQYAEGIKVTFPAREDHDHRRIALHLNCDEALELAEALLNAARRRR